MEVKKRGVSIVEFDSSKIEEAISKAMEAIIKKDNIDNDINILAAEIIESLFLEQNIHVGDSAKAYAINAIVRFIRSRLFKNYMLFITKVYNIKLEVVNKENMSKLFRFLIKFIGECVIKEIIKILVTTFIESIRKRRELFNTPYYYAQFNIIAS